jgi:hypothetical protein
MWGKVEVTGWVMGWGSVTVTVMVITVVKVMGWVMG